MHIPIGCIDITCSDDYIYLLYNANSSNSNNMDINYIKVFDWNGNQLTTIIPNVNLSVITIDIPENTIYGISEDGNPSIYKIQNIENFINIPNELSGKNKQTPVRDYTINKVYVDNQNIRVCSKNTNL